MRYQLVRWLHDLDDEPVLLFSEIDSLGYERRKVDEYGNGRLDLAGPKIQTGSTHLSETVMPSQAEIDSMDDFEARSIEAEHFEDVWQRALSWFDLDY